MRSDGRSERRFVMDIQKELFNSEVVELLKGLEYDLESTPALMLVVRSFFKDEEWIGYLMRMLNVDDIARSFKDRLSHHFEPLTVSVTSSMDIVSVVVFSESMLPSEKELESRIRDLEDDMADFFLSESFLGRIKKQVDIFQNPFKNLFDFSIGYAFIRSPREDDVMSALMIASKGAEVRKSSKFDDLTKELLRIIDRRRLESHFQPIIDLKDKKVYAYEALARGPKGSKLRRPDILFKVALYNGLEIELDRLARKTHIEKFKEIFKDQRDVKLTVNLGPFTPLLVDEVERDLKKAGIPRDRVIWEVSERTFIDDFAAFSRVIDYLNSNDYLIAVDDFGAGATTFKLIFSIYTNIIKIDKNLVEGVQADSAKKMFLERMISCFYRPDTTVVIEGVESPDEFETLLNIGYRFFQGYYFFKPGPSPVSEDQVRSKLSRIRVDPDRMIFPLHYRV